MAAALGGALLLGSPGMAAAVGTSAATGTSKAVVTCEPLEGFTRLSGGSLYRVRDPQVLTGTNTMVESGLVGAGWGGFAWTGAGGDGVLYALTKDGKLRWYRYDYAKSTWMPGSGAVIGAGFTPGVRVINIALADDGWFYTVQSGGTMVLYRHTGRLTGKAEWANSSGYKIGSGWTGSELLAPQGDGVLYRQYAGNLYWFRHSDPGVGPAVWANGGRAMKIGSGWNFYDLLAVGAGVLVATAAPSGQVSVFQHADPVAGGASWATARKAKYLARADSFGVSAAPGTCTG